MSTEFVWRFDPRNVTRASLNIGKLVAEPRHFPLSPHDAENVRALLNPKREEGFESKSKGAIGATEVKEKNKNSLPGAVREAGEAIGALLFPAAIVFLHDLIEIGRHSARSAQATNFADLFTSYLFESLRYVGKLISTLFILLPADLGKLAAQVPWGIYLLIGFSILWAIVYASMYLFRRDQETFLTTWYWRSFASALVASFVLLAISRFFALFDEIKTAARPKEYLTISECETGYEPFKVEKPRYLRLDPGNEISVGESSVMPNYDSSAPPLIFEESGDYGVVKRGSGVKPVAPAPAPESVPIEPAYLSVRLCILGGVALPVELAAVQRRKNR